MRSLPTVLHVATAANDRPPSRLDPFDSRSSALITLVRLTIIDNYLSMRNGGRLCAGLPLLYVGDPVGPEKLHLHEYINLTSYHK